MAKVAESIERTKAFVNWLQRLVAAGGRRQKPPADCVAALTRQRMMFDDWYAKAHAGSSKRGRS